MSVKRTLKSYLLGPLVQAPTIPKGLIFLPCPMRSGGSQRAARGSCVQEPPISPSMRSLILGALRTPLRYAEIEPRHWSWVVGLLEEVHNRKRWLPAGKIREREGIWPEDINDRYREMGGKMLLARSAPHCWSTTALPSPASGLSAPSL